MLFFFRRPSPIVCLNNIFFLFAVNEGVPTVRNVKYT